MTREYKLDNFNGVDLDEMAQLGAKHFTKPPEMNEEDFVRQIKQEILDRGIEITVRETTFTRRFA